MHTLLPIAQCELLNITLPFLYTKALAAAGGPLLPTRKSAVLVRLTARESGAQLVFVLKACDRLATAVGMLGHVTMSNPVRWAAVAGTLAPCTPFTPSTINALITALGTAWCDLILVLWLTKVSSISGRDDNDTVASLDATTACGCTRTPRLPLTPKAVDAIALLVLTGFHLFQCSVAAKGVANLQDLACSPGGANATIRSAFGPLFPHGQSTAAGRTFSLATCNSLLQDSACATCLPWQNAVSIVCNAPRAVSLATTSPRALTPS
mmetsp:Transcript_43062/g.68217  ORF Transcript_43062/g.68217 Transcript_43062/m.68217 type:complete len:266 (+) Transcript_43062:1352-2149(+)